jgi:hypothetical protein
LLNAWAGREARWGRVGRSAATAHPARRALQVPPVLAAREGYAGTGVAPVETASADRLALAVPKGRAAHLVHRECEAKPVLQALQVQKVKLDFWDLSARRVRKAKKVRPAYRA